MNLTAQQKRVVESKAFNILCLASAGSGKTSVLTERIRYLITEKKINPSRIVAVTFTTMAAEEMRGRLGHIADATFIGTVHAYANQICLRNGYDTSEYTAKEQFDKILTLAKTIPRKYYPKADYIFIDEAQDLSAEAYDFIEHCPIRHHYYTGDDRQTIYGFNGSSDKYIERMSKDVTYTVYKLSKDFRNTPDIITFACKLLNNSPALSPNPVPVKEEDGIVEECTIEDALDQLQQTGNWGSWFVLGRTNAEVDELMTMLIQREIPCISFKKGDLESKAELDRLLSTNQVKVLTIHTSKGLEAPNVIVTGAKRYSLEERRIGYVAATRAENTLYWCPSFSRRRKSTVTNVESLARSIYTKLDDEPDIVVF